MTEETKILAEQVIKDSSRKAAAAGKTPGKRIVIDLEHILPSLPGNVLEIGGGYGNCTRYFCNVAQSTNRVVLVVDPFEDGWGDMPKDYQYEFDKFSDSVKDFGEWLVLHKDFSEGPGVPAFIQRYSPIAFAFVDGGQTLKTVTSDLNLMDQFNVPIICVDDQLRGDVPEAIKTFLEKGRYEIVKTEEENRECYLVMK